MSTMASQSTGYLTNSCYKMGSSFRHQNITASWTMSLSDEVLDQENRLDFGQFMAREAMLDEEYWTAAWLRAETHWEDRQNDRYINNYKRKYAEQEFNALKRRCKAQIGQRCPCIVAVRTEDKNIRHTVLKSVVGTLDLIIGHLSHGEAFPGERVNAPVFCNIERRSANRYGNIANLCVAISSRRQGVARNMLHFAVRSAKANGAENVFVHVHTNNGPAQKLYQKVGFEVVEVAHHKIADEQPHLLFLRA
ncbi:GCN5-related N-acetyltransferase 6, chloroplastic isoform X1 [Lycium barbarum]|uniref:GCN5-related N-acetyltransferase 6, chloroplastic isoform X1 n=2 Tax=Lycium barbarum TaxID=112863 RepID=UPI00293E5935|nr:GCN5-related N-acetyltransferase 6, chloroplastic isoform X1 [Lycium barbarum]